MKRIRIVIIIIVIVVFVTMIMVVHRGLRLPSTLTTSQDLYALLPSVIPTDVFAGLYCEDYDDESSLIHVFVTDISGLPYQNHANLRYHKVKYSLIELDAFQSYISNSLDESIVGVYQDIKTNQLIVSVYPYREDIHKVIERYIPADAFSLEYLDSPLVLL